MIAIGVLLGAVGMVVFMVAVMAWVEWRSPKFPDAPCIPPGACERDESCAMHDTAFSGARKSIRGR